MVENIDNQQSTFDNDEDEELVECERCGDLVPYDCAYRSVSGGFLCDICYDDLYA